MERMNGEEMNVVGQRVCFYGSYLQVIWIATRHLKNHQSSFITFVIRVVRIAVGLGVFKGPTGRIEEMGGIDGRIYCVHGKYSGSKSDPNVGSVGGKCKETDTIFQLASVSGSSSARIQIFGLIQVLNGVTDGKSINELTVNIC